jgi:signal transduction histidine kinase
MTGAPNTASKKTSEPSQGPNRLGPAAAIVCSFRPDTFGNGSLRPVDLDGIAAVQGSMMRNYFRLLRAQEHLERRAHHVHAAPAAVLDQLESERGRLAHELHAGAGQALAGIKIHLELIDAALPNAPEPVRASLHRIGLLAQEALQQLRSIARRIHPPDWQRMTLAQALENLWDTCGIPRKFDAALGITPLPAVPGHFTRVLLYRTAQEALANAIRHSGASRLKLSLAQRDGFVELSVEDNGSGFDVRSVLDGPGPASAGIGLRSMRDQLRWAGGEMYLESGPGGTKLAVSVPASES